MRLGLPWRARDSASRPSVVRALRNRNFRIYISAQAVSQTGNWFQQTAEVWLILLITGSAAAVGLQTALRFGPLLLFGIPAGLLTDRVEHRKLLIGTQIGYCLTAASIAAVAFSGQPNIAVVYAVAFCRGILNAIDNPLRRSFIRDLVSDDELTNAVSLNSTMHTIARFIGPGLAGATIVAVGVPWCFTLNAASYLFVLVALFLIDRTALRPARRAAAGAAQLVDGLRYAWENRRIRRTLIMVTALGLFAANYDVIIPVYATGSFGGDASLYGIFVSTMGVGAFLGAVVVMRAARVSGSSLLRANALMTAAFLVLAFAPVTPAALLGLAFLGATNTSFLIFAQTRLQMEADDAVSGRVLAIYSVALVGTRPIGGPIVGWIVDEAGPRAAFATCAVVMGLMAVGIARTRASRAPAPAAAEQLEDDDVAIGQESG